MPNSKALPQNIDTFNCNVGLVTASLFTDFPVPRQLRADDFFGDEFVSKLRSHISSDSCAFLEALLARPSGSMTNRSSVDSIFAQVRSSIESQIESIEYIPRAIENLIDRAPKAGRKVSRHQVERIWIGPAKDKHVLQQELEHLNAVAAQWQAASTAFNAAVQFLAYEGYITRSDNEQYRLSAKGLSTLYSVPDSLRKNERLIDRLKHAVSTKSPDELMSAVGAMFQAGTLIGQLPNLSF